MANKADFMKISINGRLQATTTFSNTTATAFFTTAQASTLTVTASSSMYIASIFMWYASYWAASSWWAWFYMYWWYYWYYWWYYWSYSWYYWWYWWWWASVSSDPHFYGFDGEFYDFQGSVDGHYNLISDTNLQVNTKFGFWYKMPAYGGGGIDLTIMEAMGFKIGKNKIEFNVDGTAKIDGVLVDGDVFFHTGEGDYIGNLKRLNSFNTKSIEDFGAFITGYSLETKAYQFVIAVCTDAIHKPYLNLVATLKDTSRRPHGVVGQTADGDGMKRMAKKNAKQGEGVIEGNYLDYKVSDLWASDFKFNKFVG